VDGAGDVTKIINPARLAPKDSAQACLSCHDQAHVRNWPGSTHERNDLSCVSCHAVHDAKGKNAHLLKKPDQADVCFTCHKMQRTRTMMSSHMPLRESKLTCGDCHNPHGTTTKALLSATSVNDNCISCHQEKRGPMLFEHPPVRENCLNCHDPHGSLHNSLLVANPPRLCQSCHIGTRHPSQPQTAQARFVFNRSCVNCHPSIHGSSHPDGIRLMR
jgi:DmsE family decaheme c-type cytochrome